MTATARGTLASAGLVAVGGCLGVAARALLESQFPAAPGAWPWTTFAINVAGSLLLGAGLELLLRSGPDTGWRRTARLGAGTGVMGGFTTYSSFAVETVHLLQDGHAGLGAAYALGSVALGILAAVAGIRAAAVVHGRLARRRITAGGHR